MQEQFLLRCFIIALVVSSTVYAKKAFGCERSSDHPSAPNVVLSCPAPTKIRVNSAVYGRLKPDSEVCPFGRPHDNNQACSSTSSLPKVREVCNRQTSCSLPPTNSFFGDPCIGTYKYLDVDYDCEHCDEVIRCERSGARPGGQDVVLNCPSPKKINITYANYGRTKQDREVCSYGQRHNNNINCASTSSAISVRNACNGRSSCTIQPTNTYFGDTCPGTYKYLEVRYCCV